MKKCSKCNNEKNLDSFSKKRNGYSSYCKECNKQYQKEHYNKNKKYYNEKRYSYSQESLQYIYDYLNNKSCIICGESRIATLQFDHIDRKDKLFNLSEAKYKSIKTIKKEIQKCRILCANCHLVHTAEQLNWYKNRN